VPGVASGSARSTLEEGGMARHGIRVHVSGVVVASIALAGLAPVALADVVVSATPTPPANLASDGVFAAGGAVDIVPGRVLVRFPRGLGKTASEAAVQAGGAATERRFGSVPGLQLLRVPPDGDAVATAAALARRSDVAYAMPDVAYPLAATPNDP